MRMRELFTLFLLPPLCADVNLDQEEGILLPQLCVGNNLDEVERVVFFGSVAPSICWRLSR